MAEIPLRPDLSSLRRRLAELEGLMADPATFGDSRKAAALGAELRFTSKAVKADDALTALEKELAESVALQKESDQEIRKMAEEEILRLTPAVEAARVTLIRSIIPPNPDDSRNAMVEIRAGTGGEEASLFASELLRAYTRFAEKKGWKCELLALSHSDLGGVREAVILIEGEGATALLRHEAGVHRVQRVPATEGSGRVHTSAATVAVLAEAEEAEVVLKPEDLDMSVARASGAGGQHVNKTESAVQIIHKPTGLMVYCADERSQLRNRQKALRVLRSRLLDLTRAKERELRADTRKNMIGSGDRSERIRTYNFPQNRITDHRIDLTVHGIEQVLEGNLDQLVDALYEADLRTRAEAITGPST
ncbi:MAG: peptide chain release factor 1 [Opitutae bacterium]|jgi:peptide chain release factor 1